MLCYYVCIAKESIYQVNFWDVIIPTVVSHFDPLQLNQYSAWITWGWGPAIWYALSWWMFLRISEREKALQNIQQQQQQQKVGSLRDSRRQFLFDFLVPYFHGGRWKRMNTIAQLFQYPPFAPIYFTTVYIHRYYAYIQYRPTGVYR